MKVAISAKQNNLDSEISSFFNNAEYFIIVDSENVSNYSVIKNPHSKQLAGSEIFGAQLLINCDVQALMTGKCTPNASRIFNAAGIKVIEKIEGKVRGNIEELNQKTFINDKISKTINY